MRYSVIDINGNLYKRFKNLEDAENYCDMVNSKLTKYSQGIRQICVIEEPEVGVNFIDFYRR